MAARSWIRWALSLLVLAAFMIHTSGALRFRLLEQVEHFAYDARMRASLPNTPDPRVVIVDMDEKTLSAEGWPLSRDKLARLIELLFDRYRIRALGSDIVFAEPDRSSASALLQRLAAEGLAELPGFAERAAQLAQHLDNDRRFAEALRGRAVVLGYFHKPQLAPGETAGTGALCAPVVDAAQTALYAVDFVEPQGHGGNLPLLQEAAAGCGFFDNPTVDSDGVYRRVPLVQKYRGALYPSLALALTRVALGDPPVSLRFEPPDARGSLNLEQLTLGALAVPVDEQVAAYVPYRGPFRTFRYISVTDVLHERADAAALEQAVVLLGTSAAGLLDLRTTPVGRAYPGVEVHASLVSGMLDRRIRQKAPYYAGIETVMLALIALLMATVFPRLAPMAGAALALALGAVVLGLGWVLWDGALFIMPLGVPLLFTAVLFTVQVLYGYFVESRRARDISRMFGEYVPPEIVSEMAERGGSVSMDGEEREMTVLFSDVRGFTSISEKLDARELSELMNQFLTPLTRVIQKHRGTIDKYMGDAIMAFWGAPLPDPGHAANALQAGMEMIKAVRGLDEAFARRGWPPLAIGVGLNTGVMRVGNMGSEFRRAYTVMGDAVNVGSRIEGLTKEYGVSVICSQTTRKQAPADWAFRELDRVCVKGKKEPVTIYEPLGPKEALDPALRQDLARHRGAIGLYRAQAWDQAEAEFFSLSRSGRPHPVYELFLQRIAYLRRNPPGAEWDGAFAFTHK